MFFYGNIASHIYILQFIKVASGSLGRQNRLGMVNSREAVSLGWKFLCGFFERTTDREYFGEVIAIKLIELISPRLSHSIYMTCMSEDRVNCDAIV